MPIAWSCLVLVLALCLQLTCPLKCCCCCFVASNWHETGQHIEHHMAVLKLIRLVIELIGSGGACCVANFVYYVVSLAATISGHKV